VDESTEGLDSDLILGLQLQEYNRTGRLQRQLLNDAMIPQQRRGRITPLDVTRKIRMGYLKLSGAVLEFELLEFFFDDFRDLTAGIISRGYRLSFAGRVTVLLVAGNNEAWLHFRDERAGTFVTLFWSFNSSEPIRAIDQLYATADEAIALINGGREGIERGYQFRPDPTVSYPFPGTRRDQSYL
jgi:hypothetical protein